MTTSVTRPCFTTQHKTCKTKTKTDFWSQTGLVRRPTVLDHIAGKYSGSLPVQCFVSAAFTTSSISTNPVAPFLLAIATRVKGYCRMTNGNGTMSIHPVEMSIHLRLQSTYRLQDVCTGRARI